MSWPATLTEVDPAGTRIVLRPIRVRDRAAWIEVRSRNEGWLRPWDATVPPTSRGHGGVPGTFSTMVRRMRHEAREGRMLPWIIEVDGRLVGQLTVGGIAYGSYRGAYIGYWIDRQVAGRGIVPTAVAMALDYCLDDLELHRVEINIRPENRASLRVVAKLGIRQEGYRPSYLHINGAWHDHVVYVVMPGDYPSGVLQHWRAIRGDATSQSQATRHADR